MRALKLFILTISAAAVIAGVCILPRRICFTDGKNYEFYCGDSSKNCKVVTSENPALDKLLLKEVCGESCGYDTIELESFLKNYGGKVVFKEELSDSVNYYCTADLPYSVTLRGYEINLHICVRKDGVKVGSPIIFGGY